MLARKKGTARQESADNRGHADECRRRAQCEQHDWRKLEVPLFKCQPALDAGDDVFHGASAIERNDHGEGCSRDSGSHQSWNL
ncbi:MAG: hypothetical protein JO108_02460 [Acidobacteriaceae bacterium]|nr:hypothetical protein [Acidobacteriaceae bacterium]